MDVLRIACCYFPDVGDVDHVGFQVRSGAQRFTGLLWSGIVGLRALFVWPLHSLGGLALGPHIQEMSHKIECGEPVFHHESKPGSLDRGEFCIVGVVLALRFETKLSGTARDNLV